MTSRATPVQTMDGRVLITQDEYDTLKAAAAWSEVDTATIPLKRYRSLMDDAAWRVGMEAAGIDNWDGYSFGLEIYTENHL